jgi:osmotically-inducible protein OsmY
MKRANFIRYFFIGFVLVTFFAGCAATQHRESTGQYVDDSVITTKVKSLIANDDFLKSFQISVETYKGTVQLSGFVNSTQASAKASELANSVEGVKSVKNDLIVK